MGAARRTHKTGRRRIRGGGAAAMGGCYMAARRTDSVGAASARTALHR